MNSGRSDYKGKNRTTLDKIMEKNNYMAHVTRVKEQTFLKARWKDREDDRLKMGHDIRNEDIKKLWNRCMIAATGVTVVYRIRQSAHHDR